MGNDRPATKDELKSLAGATQSAKDERTAAQKAFDDKMDAQTAQMLGFKLGVGRVVHFFHNPDEPWAAIVVAVKKDGVVDLVYFRPDGQNLRAYAIPPRTPKQQGGCWAPPERL